MRFYEKLKYQLYLVPLLAALLFYNEFLAGFKGTLSFIFNFLKFVIFVIFQRPDAQILVDAFNALNPSVLFFIMGGVAYFLLYRFSLFVMAQFALPVTQWEDRKKAWNRLVLFARGKHGPAIFVKGGEKKFRQGELDSARPGVVLVDSSSAVVLVQHDDMNSMSLPSEDEWEAVRNKPVKKGKAASIYEIKEPEVKGPGVVFTEQGQKIDDTVDLRRQVRTSGDLEVYTRDGIKVNSKVTVVFSLSDAPETMFVGYVGGKFPTNLKILKISQSDADLTINGAVDIDMDDALDVLRASLPLPEADPSNSFVPYAFDPDRILKAVFNQARDKSGALIPWHRAPLESATDIFRKMLSDVPYDKFFSSDFLNRSRYRANEDKDNEKIPSQIFLSELKQDFSIRVKSRGIMTFQFIEHLNGDYFSIGQTVRLDSLRRQTPVTLTREKFNFFRHMGIVVKAAMLGDVQASNPEIRIRMLDAWKAKVEREIAISNAEYELETIRVRNRNRAQVQEDMTYLLSGVFKSTPHFDEALALRVLQALETSITDSSSKDMSATELHEILKNIHDWILLDQPSDKNNPPNPPEEQTVVT